MPYVPSKLNPNLEVLGEVQEFNFPDTQNRGRVDIRTELAPAAGVPTQSGLSLKDSAFNGYRFEYQSNLDPAQNTLGLYKLTNNERAQAAMLLFAETPTLDNHVATKKYVDDHSGGGGGGDATKTYVDQQDAATLVSAKSHADTGDATTLASAKDYSDTGDAATLASAKDWALNPHATEVRYYMDDPAADVFTARITGGLTQQGWMKHGYLCWDFSTHKFTISMTPDVGLGSVPLLEIDKNSIYAQLKTIEAVTSSTNPQGVLNKFDVEAKDSAVLASAKAYADTGDTTTLNSAKSYSDTANASTLTQAKAYTDTKSSPIVLDANSIGILSALGFRMKNNASSATSTVFLNGNGDGWTDTYSETWSNIWSRTISFKTTTYLTFQNASGTITISAAQPIVMSSTYTPTAAKYVATKDYVDLGAIPIGGILDIPSGATLPSNFLLANGSSFNPGTYPTLYSLLGSSVTPVVSARVSGFKCIIRAS